MPVAIFKGKMAWSLIEQLAEKHLPHNVFPFPSNENQSIRKTMSPVIKAGLCAPPAPGWELGGRGAVRYKQMQDACSALRGAGAGVTATFPGLEVLPRSMRPRQTGCAWIYFGLTAANTGFMKMFGARLPGDLCTILLLY